MSLGVCFPRSLSLTTEGVQVGFPLVDPLIAEMLRSKQPRVDIYQPVTGDGNPLTSPSAHVKSRDRSSLYLDTHNPSKGKKYCSFHLLEERLGMNG